MVHDLARPRLVFKEGGIYRECTFCIFFMDCLGTPNFFGVKIVRHQDSFHVHDFFKTGSQVWLRVWNCAENGDLFRLWSQTANFVLFKTVGVVFPRTGDFVMNLSILRIWNHIKN